MDDKNLNSLEPQQTSDKHPDSVDMTMTRPDDLVVEVIRSKFTKTILTREELFEARIELLEKKVEFLLSLLNK